MTSLPSLSNAPSASLVPLCCICQLPETSNKKICHFEATKEHSEPLYIHEFCGRTAAILPNVNRPDLEILNKSQLYTKFRAGHDVALAMIKARKATIVGNDDKSTIYYLTKDFNDLPTKDKKRNTKQGSAGKTFSKELLVSGANPAFQPRRVSPDAVAMTGVFPVTSPPPAAKKQRLAYVTEKEAKSETSVPSNATTPYNMAMERLHQVYCREAAVSYTMIRGVGNFSASSCLEEASQEDVDVMRLILLTKHRQLEIQSAQEACDKKDETVEGLWTKVLSDFETFDIVDESVQFNILLGFTLVLRQNSEWMKTKASDSTTSDMVTALARYWKDLLSKTSKILGIDDEFTRPGVVALLEELRVL
jgi:hypothetical protein